MWIRNIVTAQECLNRLQFKVIRIRLFNRHKMATKNRADKNMPAALNYSLVNGK